MRVQLSDALDRCLERIKKGETIEACMAEYPDMRRQLEPLLYTAASLSASPRVSPSDEFRRISKARLMGQLWETPVRAPARSGRPLPAVDWLAKIAHVLGNAVTRPRPLAVPVAIALVLAIGGSLFLVVTLSLLSQPSALASQGTLSVLSGTVQIQAPGSNAWQVAQDGTTLGVGTRVKTAPGSHAQLTFFEGSTIKLEPNTDIEIQRVEPVDEESADIVIKQWLGRTWSRVVTRLDPGARYEIQTPSAYALVRGTLFETEVDEAGSTVVRTAEGVVSVGAQNEEVYLSAGQESAVEVGQPPSPPRPMTPADSRLVIRFGMPAVASVCDPSGSSTGYLPNGVSFNQIAGSETTSPEAGRQVITIPGPEAGRYLVVLRCIGDGTCEFVVEGLFKGETVFIHADSYEVTGGSEWVIPIDLDVEDGRIVGAEVGDIEPLGEEAPGEVLVTEGAKSRSVPIPTPEASGEPAVTPKTHALAIVSGPGGSVTDPGQGAFFYEPGTVVELVATADEGWRFDRWTGNVADPLSPKTTITITRGEVVNASFMRIR